jgi:hypothetical protein
VRKNMVRSSAAEPKIGAVRNSMVRSPAAEPARQELA